MKQVTVTPMEKQVIDALVNEMYAERGFSDVGLGEVCAETNLSPRVVRGVVGSLVKKGLISVWNREGDTSVNWRDPYTHIYYLTSETEGLVEHWLEEGAEPVELIVKG